jgi:hypothetical protein
VWPGEDVGSTSIKGLGGESREVFRAIYVGAIKKDISYLHAIKKFGDTSMP